MWIALGQGLRQATDLACILPDLEAILAFTRDLQQRLATGGVDGVSGALGLHRLLRETLAAIPRADIDRALAEIDALARTLARYADVLAELKTLRDRLAV